MWTTLFRSPIPAGTSRYGELSAALIHQTIERLQQRIYERFPTSGLWKVSRELATVSSHTSYIVHQLARPFWWLRTLAFLLTTGILLLIVVIIRRSFGMEAGAEGWAEWIQAIESAINELIFLALALYFFMSAEQRLKRWLAIRAIHRLRSIAHIIDMHQLTKDPVYVLKEAQPTASSPERTMTSFELVRYLDYCTELLSLTSKLAALYVQRLNDSVVLNAVNDLESLADGLSGKIWQKIMILDMAVPSEEE